jgi:hypothetical protein
MSGCDNRRGEITSIEQLDRLRAMMLALPIERKSRFTPWGYKPHKDNPKLLEPIEEHFRLLYEARTKYLKTCSFIEVAAWLSAKTGVYISDEGLTRIMNRRPPDKAVLLSLEKRLKI